MVDCVENKIKTKRILQICRLTPLWGMDLFCEITHAVKAEHTEITTVFLSGKAQPELNNQYHGNVVFLELNHHSLFWRFKAFLRLLTLCRKNQFDITLCHHYKPTVVMHMVSCFIKKTQLYSMYHDSASFRKKFQQKFLHRIKNKWHFIAVSAKLKKEMQSFNIPENRITVIHNTVDIEKLRQEQFSREIARKKLSLPQDAFIFGTLGRLSPEKGHHILIDAFPHSKSIQHPKIYLAIIGSGPLEKALRDQVKNSHLENRVLFITDCANDGARYLKAFDIFVFPSLREAFGIVLLEAACAELPIIASHVGGIPEAVGNHGYLVPASDAAALKKAMEKYLDLNQDERINLGQQALKYTQENFSLEKYHQAIQIMLNIRPVSFDRR